MMGFIAALGVVCLLGTGIYTLGYAAKKSSLIYVLLLETIAGLILIFPLLLFIDKLSIQQIFYKPSVTNWLWLSAASIFGFVGGNYFSLLNLKTAGEKTNSLLSPAITALAIILSGFVFKEKLTLIQYAGIAVTLGAVVWFLLKQKKTDQKKNKNTGTVSGIATVVCISLTIICSIKGAATGVTFLQAIWLRLLLALFIILPLFLIATRNNLLKKQPSKFYLLLLIGVVCQTILANYFWFYASFQLGIAVFQVILATLPLWVYAVDVYVLNKSSPSVSFLFAAVLAVVGICIVVLWG